MKQLFILTLISFVIASCNVKEKSIEDLIAKGNLENIRAKKAALDTDQQLLVEKLNQLEVAIGELDTINKLPLVTTFKVNDTLFNHYLELQGSVKTKQNVVIYPEMAGTLLRVYVKEGKRVVKGQLLASIDDGGLGQQVAQLQIQADLAKTTFERQERLWKQKIGSEIQYLQAKSAFEGQQKAVNQLKSQLAKTTVRAPFSGVIDDVITDQGSVVTPGQTQLMRILNLNNMYITANVPESYISNISKNKNVIVNLPVLGKTIHTKVRQTGSFINPANRTFKIEVSIPNKDRSIKPNLTAKLMINDYSSPNAILIPQSIISENANGEQFIYVVKDRNGKLGVSERVIIKTGKTQDGVIEVLEGLEKGFEIIQEGARSVKDGQTVEIIKL
jgi:RND family efflux transporter MFP subunit